MQVLTSKDRFKKASLSRTPPKKVLVVDDGPSERALVSHLLKKEGAEVSKAANGKEAVEMALSERFDLIFMDMQMPVLDGFSAAKLIKENGCSTPIVALTGSVEKEDVDKCKEICSHYLEKPFRREELLGAFRRFALAC